MARRVFFSFDFSRDNWRVNQVRNSWVTKGVDDSFLDAAAWEKVKKKNDAVIKKWIDAQMKGTSVTVVLIGQNTSSRRYVQYEICQSHIKKKGMLGIYIHQLKDKSKKTDSSFFSGPPKNPFEQFSYGENFLGLPKRLSSLYDVYDWVDDDGYSNISDWIDEAASNAGR